MIRVLSAAVLVALVVLTIWSLPWWGTAAFAVVVAGLAGWELARLATAVGAAVPSGIAALAAVVACLGFLLAEPFGPPHYILGASLLSIMLATSLVALAEGAPSPATLTRAAMLGFVPMYVGLPLGALAWLRLVGPETLTWLLVVIAVSDSAQYYTGRMLGRRKLAPAISPAKTIEGAAGGLVVAAVVGVLLSGWGLRDASPATAAVLASLLALAGMAGDLFESLLKRSAGVKDSSSLIPGHGGVLDRIDSYLFAAPLFYLYLRLFS